MVCHGSHQYTSFMLAYIPAPWILWVMKPTFYPPWEAQTPKRWCFGRATYPHPHVMWFSEFSARDWGIRLPPWQVVAVVVALPKLVMCSLVQISDAFVVGSSPCGTPAGATTCVVDSGGSDWPLLVPAGAMLGKALPNSKLGLVWWPWWCWLWMRCLLGSAWDGVIWIKSRVGQKESLRWLIQEAAKKGDHLTVIVPTNNGMGWHGEDPVPSEYLRMPRGSS